MTSSFPFDSWMKHSPLEMWMKPGRDAAGMDLWAKPGRDAFEFWISFFPTAPLFGVEWRFSGMTDPALNPFMMTGMPGMPGMPGMRAAARASHPGELASPAAADDAAAKPVARAADTVGEAAKEMTRIAGETAKSAARTTSKALATGADLTGTALRSEDRTTDAKAPGAKATGPKSSEAKSSEAKPVDIAEEAGKTALHATETAASAVEGAATTAEITAEETADAVDKGARRGAKANEKTADQARSTTVETTEVVEHAIAAGPKPKMLLSEQPDNVDDLKAIKGIGPDLERQLNGLGLYRFDQLAKMTDADLAWIDANITRFKGRCFRDDWVGQAKSRLAK